jgi:restriction system protein
MWVVRLAHPTVNRFRVIAERTREAAEKKAADQMAKWAKFGVTIATAEAVSRGEKRWLNPRAMKQLLSPEHRQRQLADQLTAQVQGEIATLALILHLGTLLSYKAESWSGPAPTRPEAEPIPKEPSREPYAPHLSIADKLIPGRRNQKKAEAEKRFVAAHAEWEQSRSAVEKRNRDREEKYRRELSGWESRQKEFADSWKRRDPKAVRAYCEAILKASPYPCIAASVAEIAIRQPFSDSLVATEHPDTFPRAFELDCAAETGTVVVDYELPAKEAMPSAKGYKYAVGGDKVVPVPMPRTSVEQTYESVLYQVALRTVYELSRSDGASALDYAVFNGWVSALDSATGRRAHTCILTVQAGKKEFHEINLADVDPKACFRKLKGISGARLAAMSPVRPILQMNREDKRFINARPVMDALDTSTNLAAMDWEDFEQLIRDVFEKEFSGDGGEVKITRASRDHGVDAVAFDPDPIRGGKDRHPGQALHRHGERLSSA